MPSSSPWRWHSRRHCRNARRSPKAGAPRTTRTPQTSLLVFQGPQGYVSPAWYGAGPSAPTWNFTVVHVYGVAEVLDGDAGFTGTIWFRIRATRVLAKAKLSQDKPRAVQERVVASLERPGPYQQPELAATRHSGAEA
jgi:transcriptional regulator